MAKGIRYRSKELSWLSFNDRVLQEAADPSVPLGDRIRFMGIYSRNLDEFFRTRVANLKHLSLIKDNNSDKIMGSPDDVLEQIHTVVLDQSRRFESNFDNLLEELKSNGVYFVQYEDLDPEQRQFVDLFFQKQIRPRVFPMMIDKRYKMPFLKDRALYLAVRLNREGKPARYSIIEIPTKVLPRFVVIPAKKNKTYVMFVDDVVRSGFPNLFRMLQFDTFEAYTIKITRDAALSLEDNLSESYINKVNTGLTKRKCGAPSRLVYDKTMPPEMLEFFLRKLKLKDRDILVPGGKYHYFRDFLSFDRVLDLPNVPTLEPLPHRLLAGRPRILKVMAKHDILLHFPYHSFDHVLDLLREVSIDPRVESIHITLYRLARNSSVVNALINASRNRKKVTVVLELQARFDEKSNIYWASKLEEEGVRVIFGAQDLKAHVKTCLIARREKHKTLRYYFAAGTGNFNEDTARVYTDFLLLSSNQKIATELRAVFKMFETGMSDASSFKNIIVSPLSTRTRLLKMIKKESNNARKGNQAFIDIKINNLSDREIIDALYKAAANGVKIRLVVRGMFSIITDLPELNGNLQARSIVDKFLEHSRMIVFCNGGDEKVYISSADLLARNLDRRVEVICPIEDPGIRSYLKDIFSLYWQDGAKARILDHDLSNQQRGSNHEIRSQDAVYEYTRAIHGD